MQRLLKPQVQKRAEEIKRLILAGVAFEKPLERLYLDLSLAGRHDWTVQVYQLLLLYTGPEDRKRLLHPALLQAFISLGLTTPAMAISQELLKQNPHNPETKKLTRSLHTRKENTLPAYTPVASLSKYAAPNSLFPKPHPLPPKWQQLSQLLTAEKLAESHYFEKRRQLARAPKSCRSALLQTFDELVCCYLLQQRRAVAALCGALLETLLALLISKRHPRKGSTSRNDISKHLDLHLYDLIGYCQQNALLQPATLKLLRAARMQRNFIHPGKELLEKSSLTAAGMRICFLAVLEVIDEVFA